MLTVLASTCLAGASPGALLDANRLATGGPQSGTLTRTYRYASEGMTGSASSLVDAESGNYADHEQAGLPQAGEGFNGKTPWMTDSSGFNSPQQGGNKHALAVNRAYRNSNSWWRPGRGGARMNKTDCNSIEVTPPGGEPFQASFDPQSHLLSKVRERFIFGTTRDTTFADYRRCGQGLVPNRVETIVDGDSASSGVFNLLTCAVGPVKPQLAFAMPLKQPRDWKLPKDGRATVSMRPHDQAVMIQAKINGKGPYVFYLDTGGHDILSPRLARDLGLKVEGEGQSGGAGEGTVQAGYAKVASIDVGGAVLTNQTVKILETSPPEVVGELIGGIIGLQFLERFVTKIDYKRGTVTFEDPHLFSSAERAATGTPIPFRLYDHMPQVAGAFEDLPAQYDIDTGSGQFVTMTRPFVEQTDLRARYPGAITMVDGFGTGGPTRSTMVRAGTLSLGPFAVKHIPASLATAQHGAFSDPAYSGNVGNGVLRQFQVTFDYPRTTMYLTPVVNPDLSPHRFNHTGVTIVADGEKMKVVDAALGTPAEEAGLKAGDIIRTIGGKDVTKLAISKVRKLFREAPDSKPLQIEYDRGGHLVETTLIPRELIL